LFDPVNPDKDTMPSQRFTRTERLDNEFWLLQKLEDVMEKANFHKLSDDTVTKALQEHTNQGIRVNVLLFSILISNVFKTERRGLNPERLSCSFKFLMFYCWQL
jgi:hypothetical protein